jgi:hypothetical protein
MRRGDGVWRNIAPRCSAPMHRQFSRGADRQKTNGIPSAHGALSPERHQSAGHFERRIAEMQFSIYCYTLRQTASPARRRQPKY